MTQCTGLSKGAHVAWWAEAKALTFQLLSFWNVTWLFSERLITFNEQGDGGLFFCLFLSIFLKMRSLVKKSAMRAVYLKGSNTLALKNLLHWNQYETHFLLSSAAKYTGFLIFLIKRSHWWWLVISGDEWSLDPSGFSANC